MKKGRKLLFLTKKSIIFAADYSEPGQTKCILSD